MCKIEAPESVRYLAQLILIFVVTSDQLNSTGYRYSLTFISQICSGGFWLWCECRGGQGKRFAPPWQPGAGGGSLAWPGRRRRELQRGPRLCGSLWRGQGPGHHDGSALCQPLLRARGGRYYQVGEALLQVFATIEVVRSRRFGRFVLY